MPGDPGGPVVTMLVCLFHICTRGCGCIVRPAFPTPSFSRREEFRQTSGTSCRENAKVCLNVIASEAMQSILPRKGRMDCFVAEFIIGRAFARPVGSSQ